MTVNDFLPGDDEWNERVSAAILQSERVNAWDIQFDFQILYTLPILREQLNRIEAKLDRLLQA